MAKKAGKKKERVKLLDDFLILAEEWSLSAEEQCQLVDNEVAYKSLRLTCEKVPLQLDEKTIARLVTLLDIWNDIHVLYPEPNCRTYIRRTNKYFDGQSPLEVILNESMAGMVRVQVYLKGSMLGGYL